MRAAICADSAAAMKAVWPKVAIVTPPPPAACAAQAVVWGLCNAPYAGGASGSSIQLADTTAPDTGTVTVACTNGALAQTLASCVTVVPPPPGAPVWEVTPNGTTPTRPTYPAIQGTDGKWKRASTSSNARVNTLTVCDCAAIDVFEFNITHYCKVPVDPAPQVAACRLRK